MWRFLLLLILAIFVKSEAVMAGQRIALVIGNGSYSSHAQLDNPPSDARLISAALREVDFDVIMVVDANQKLMKQKIKELGDKLRAAGKNAVGLFYYAGHGIQASGSNYLIPIRAILKDEADLDIEAVEASWVLDQMKSASNAVNIVILDACRNNPFSTGTRSGTRGLARISAPTGSFVAYATAPGSVAEDGFGRNSSYAAAIAAVIRGPGMGIEQVFKEVRVKVFKATGGLQTPWDSSSMIEDFYFRNTREEVSELPPPERKREETNASTLCSGRYLDSDGCMRECDGRLVLGFSSECK